MVGSPARVIGSLDEYLNKERNQMAASPCYGGRVYVAPKCFVSKKDNNRNKN